jgi:hypothetical protein
MLVGTANTWDRQHTVRELVAKLAQLLHGGEDGVPQPRVTLGLDAVNLWQLAVSESGKSVSWSASPPVSQPGSK